MIPDAPTLQTVTVTAARSRPQTTTGPASFTQKQLRVTFVLAGPGTTNFPGTQSNALVLTGLRTVALLQSYAGSATNMDLQVYGMSQYDMNALSVILYKQAPTATLMNVVTLEANSGSGWSQIFTGNIIECSPQYIAMPDVCLHVQARIGYAGGISVGTPLSYPQGTTVAQAVQTIAKAMGFLFANNGVAATLPKGSYYPGAPWTQLQTICNRAGVDFYFDPNQTIVICPKGRPRINAKMTSITPESGLIGYPQIEAFGITIKVLFNPAFILAGKISVAESDVPAANGIWMPYSASHQLEAVKFGGAWFSTLQCVPVLQ